MPYTSSHYPYLFNEVQKKNALFSEGIPVANIPSFMKRNDGGEIFDEGANFSGIARDGSAEACITVAASPHILPSITKSKLAEAARMVLGESVKLPESEESCDLVSPQLMVWWRKNNKEYGVVDLQHISALTNEEQRTFYHVIAKQTVKAVDIVTDASGKPTIWGSWGFSSPEQRQRTGRGRGVPTNRFGHLHVIDFAAEIAHEVMDKHVSTATKLNHYEPWASLLYTNFSTPFARTISRLANARVDPFSETARDTMGRLRKINNGYTVTFDEQRDMESSLKTLVNVIATFDILYRTTTQNHELYYKYPSNHDKRLTARQNIVNTAEHLSGFTSEEAQRFASFTLMIRPTYAQVCTWLNELNQEQAKDADIKTINTLKERYERIYDYIISMASSNDSRFSLIRGTITPPEEYQAIGSVWPERASATYIINDFERSNSSLQVRSLRIIPGIDSTESAPEQIKARLLRRAIS
jgi:hypothetical protein